MFGWTSRLLRRAGVSISLAFAVTGCQSVTQQKAAWWFPPMREEIDERPIVTVENRQLPPLPTHYEKWLEFQDSRTAIGMPQAGLMKTNEPAEHASSALRDSAIVPASTFPAADSSASAQPKLSPASSLSPTSVAVADPRIPARVTSESESIVPVAPPPVAPPPVAPVRGRNVPPPVSVAMRSPTSVSQAVAPPSMPVPLDSRATRQVVKRLVGASDELIRTSAEPGPEDDFGILRSVTGPAQFEKLRNHPDFVTANSARNPEDASAFGKSRPEQLPLETIPDMPAESADSRSGRSVALQSLTISKAAICKAVEGRGRFSALPEQFRVPGAPMIVYWEMDALAREPVTQSFAFTAVVEVVSTDRDEILASVRESVRDSGPRPEAGDFAALRWKIPAELKSGEYRIRITVTDDTTKRTAMTQADFALGRGPIASRLVLP